MTREQLAHLDARYRALNASGSDQAEQAFREWRQAALAFADGLDSRRQVSLGERDAVALEEDEAGLGVEQWDVGEEPHLEFADAGFVGVHAPIFDPELCREQSPIFTGGNP